MISSVHRGRQAPEGIGVFHVEYDTQAECDQLLVLMKAARLYSERNAEYKDNWHRMGWRGMLVRCRERSERLWDAWWDRSQRPTADPDDALDLINFAAFMVRATRGETTRDGSWW